jgi:hypothetical protein
MQFLQKNQYSASATESWMIETFDRTEAFRVMVMDGGVGVVQERRIPFKRSAGRLLSKDL